MRHARTITIVCFSQLKREHVGTISCKAALRSSLQTLVCCFPQRNGINIALASRLLLKIVTTKLHVDEDELMKLDHLVLSFQRPQAFI
jgi:hypothetical protein